MLCRLDNDASGSVPIQLSSWVLKILSQSSSFLEFNLYTLKLARSKHNDIVRDWNFTIVGNYVVYLCQSCVGVDEKDSDFPPPLHIMHSWEEMIKKASF